MTAPGRLPSLPRLDPAAYQGIAGKIVSDIAPHTEADPAAMLVSVLGAAGAMIGDGPHVMIGAAKHPARIWPLIIGRTASGRKGESWDQTEQLIIQADANFAANRLLSGLSTGEGIIGCFTGDKDDDGTARNVADKRLLVVESEFARLLVAARREGNTLSQALRQLWDKGGAGIITRAQPLHCHGAHLVIVAHVTPRELIAKLTDSDISGGLINRFLPVLAQRPHLLPNPCPVDAAHLGRQLGARTAKAASAPRRLYRDDAAQELWDSAYAAMARDEVDGPLGEVLARGPSYTMRLALTYALLDDAGAIQEAHLRAGLAVWAYAAASARRVFADTARQTDADKLADYLADSVGGRTRTEIRDLFKRNRTSKQIDALIQELSADVATEEDRSDPGRPVTRVYWTGPARDSLSSLLAGEPQSERPNDVTIFPGQSPGGFGRTTKGMQEKPQVNGHKSSGRNVVREDAQGPSGIHLDRPGEVGADFNHADLDLTGSDDTSPAREPPDDWGEPVGSEPATRTTSPVEQHFTGRWCG